MNQLNKYSWLLISIFLINGACSTQEKEQTSRYPITPVSFTDVTLNDNFWLPRININTKITIPIAFKQSEETGRIKNFEVAGGLSAGTFSSKYAFDDSDVFKILEGASYSLMISPDPDLDAYLDSLIHKIAAAQEDDGYLYTNRTILGDSAHEMAGAERWSNVSEHSHELYNVGHMYEAAVAHYQATGKRSFLDVAIKNANLIDEIFGWGKREAYPGHQEIEIGLVKLYRVAKDQRYLDLAKFFLDVRGPDGWEYNQAHKRVIDQREPVGHAVRALYMYSGMADIAALTQDLNYLNATQSIWDNLVSTKLYITGGVGQTGGNEGFGTDYELPNETAYCETCASIANVFWNHRMFLLTGEGKFIDVLERTLYNALLSGVGLSGDLFFYPNPLESDGSHQRKEWFGCACCPSNICRFLPSIPGYVYAYGKDEIFINLFIESETTIQTRGGKVRISQEGNYPWEGRITLKIEPSVPTHHKIHIRIPGWARNEPVPGNLYRFKRPLDKQFVIYLNGVEIDFKVRNGYAIIDREWDENDNIELFLPMPVNEIIAHRSVRENVRRFAIQRGPLIYCLEGEDNKDIDIKLILASHSTGFVSYFDSNIMNGIQIIQFEGRYLNKNHGDNKRKLPLKAIPYAYWANRGPSEMLVWIPYTKNVNEN
jgi:DUF1680 family protein